MEFHAKEQLPGLLDWMRQQMKACGGKTAVIGISGGKDSSTAFECKWKCRLHGFRVPFCGKCAGITFSLLPRHADW